MKRLIFFLTISAAVLHGQEAAPPKPLRIAISVSREEYPLAKMKADLAQLLVESLVDEGKGMFNAKREEKIRKLMIGIQKWVPPVKPLDDTFAIVMR